MPGKSQSHTDAVLNVLRGADLTGVAPYVGRPPMTIRPARNWRATVMRGRLLRSARP